MKRYFQLSVIVLSIVALFAASCTPEEKPVAVSGIEISNPSPLKMNIGDTDTLKVNVLPAEATKKEFEVLVTDSSIVSVSDTYLITALAEGTATITARSLDNGMEASIEVIVMPEPITFEFDVTENPEADSLFIATITPSDLQKEYLVMDINEYSLHAYAESGSTLEEWMTAYIKDCVEELNEMAGGLLTPEEVATLFINMYARNGVYEDYALEPVLGKNYIFAFTLGSKGDVQNLQYEMYMEILPEGDVEVKLGLVAAQAKDLVISLDFPSNWIRNPYYPDENHPVLISWGKKKDIASFTDEQLVARDFDMLKAEAEETDTTVVSLIGKHQIYWRDQSASDPLYLRGTESLYAEEGFEPATEYVIYAYAMQYDYATGEVFAATKIARLEASTIELSLVKIAFEFGIDRIIPDDEGNLMAYFSADADDAYQRFTFCAFNEADLATYAKDGSTPTIDQVAEKILQEHIDNYHSQYYTQPLENWTYFDYGYMPSHTGIKINADGTKNKWYVIAGALDETLSIGSEVKYELIDLTGKTSTEVDMNLTVEGTDGSYTYSVNPDTTPYILTVIKAGEMKQWLEANGHNTTVPAYVDAQIKAALKTGTVAEYLAANGKTAAVSESITVTEDTYVIAYTVYEKSGLANGLDFELLKAPASAMETVYLTAADGAVVDFNNAYTEYIFKFAWKDGIVQFENADGEFGEHTNWEYTHTKHIILDQEYSNSNELYKIDLAYTYKGDPEKLLDENNVFAEEATLVTTKNTDGTYTVTAELKFTDNTQCRYIYTGAIANEVINGK